MFVDINGLDLATLRRKKCGLALARSAAFPVVGISDPVEHLTQFVIPVQHRSDGTEITKP